jgi:zinc protease
MPSTLLPIPRDRGTRPHVQRLSTGLTLITESMPIEAVNLSLWLNIGSAVEADEINGMAHFLEHMVFKGTKRIPNRGFERQIEERGAVTNAATSQDYTHYYITAAPQDFATLAPLQIDVVLNALIPDLAFEQEQAVVLEEIRRADDNPQRRVFQKVLDLVFGCSPYSRPVLGPAERVAQFTPGQMRRFHQTWYRPASITAVAVGNLPSEELAGTIADAFEQLMGSPQPASLHDIVPRSPLSAFEPAAPFDQITRYEFEDRELQQARLVMAWRVPGLAEMSKTYALDVLASVLSQGRSSRLVQDLKEQKRWVNSIQASNMTYQHQGMFYVAAQLPVEHIKDAEAAIAQHIAELGNTQNFRDELSRVQQQVANRYIFGTETPSDRAGLYGYYHAMTGDLAPALTYPDQIYALTPEDLQQAAQDFLRPDAYAVVVARPGE